ncbi:hypothetical protein ACOSP6_11035 [Tenacibaculum sp. MEBiC06402]|uniref:hypothetical protein n=1 Tax=unclassified Tenacibaculum TaxID=2635139 RepID=UPI003B9D65C9
MKIHLDYKILKYLLSLGKVDLSYNAQTKEVESTSGSNAILPYPTATTAGLLQRSIRNSFKPTLFDAGGTASYTFTNSGSFYERIGNLVYFHVILTNINQTGTPSNTLCIGNFPYSVTSTISQPYLIAAFTGSNVNFYNIIARSRGGNTPGFDKKDIVFEYSNSLSGSIGQGTNQFMQAVSFTNGIINVSGWYPITFGSADYVNETNETSNNN